MTEKKLTNYLMNRHGIEKDQLISLVDWIGLCETGWSTAFTVTHKHWSTSTILAKWNTEDVETLGDEADRIEYEGVQLRGSAFIEHIQVADCELQPQLEKAIDLHTGRMQLDSVHLGYGNVARTGSEAEFRNMLKEVLNYHNDRC